MARKFKGGKQAPAAACAAREGVVICRTSSGKVITVGLWKPAYGPVTNIRWWDFLKTEKAARERTRISYTVEYSKDRRKKTVKAG